MRKLPISINSKGLWLSISMLHIYFTLRVAQVIPQTKLKLTATSSQYPFYVKYILSMKKIFRFPIHVVIQ